MRKKRSSIKSVLPLETIKNNYNEQLLDFCIDSNSRILILKKIEKMYPNMIQIDNYIHSVIINHLCKYDSYKTLFSTYLLFNIEG